MIATVYVIATVSLRYLPWNGRDHHREPRPGSPAWERPGSARGPSPDLEIADLVFLPGRALAGAAAA
jgi:hypothetical protein